MKSLNRLAEIANERILFGDFDLSSGEKSSLYFDGRKVTLSQEGLKIITDIIVDIITPYCVQAIGGPTIGADAVVGAAVYSFENGRCPIDGFLIRSEKKEHGTNQQLEGNLTKGNRVAIFDDTIYSGDSLLRVIKFVEDYGCEVGIVTALLDRQRGGLERICDAGYDIITLLKLGSDGVIVTADIWDRTNEPLEY